MFYKIGLLESFAKIYSKISTLESLFNEVARLKRLLYKRFPRIFVKFSRTPYNETRYTTKVAYG